uniref:Uncharacterized protein n=1 Tax=Chenopodium quinoa TaxID=63459 RepID=A0A803LD36_CHEQI
MASIESPQNFATLPLNQNPASIYYIHPSDANSAHLVSFKFNGDGFTSWKRAMLLTLSAKNKVGFVNGDYCRPVDEASVERKAWDRCNDLSVWDAIDEAHPLPYCTCQLTKRVLERHQQEMVIQFMMKLSDQFATVRATNSNSGRNFRSQPLGFSKPNVQTQFRSSAGDQKFDKPDSRFYCTHCEIPGHSVDRCFKLHGYPPNFKGFKDKRVAAMSSADQEAMETDESSGDHVTIEQYNQFMPYMKSQKEAEAKEINAKGYAMMAGNLCLFSSSADKWLLDSGATDHIFSDIALFAKLTPVLTPYYITIPDGSRILVKNTGVVKLNDEISLLNVLHVPDFKFNLISVHKLCKDLCCELHFTHDKCFVQTQTGQLIHLGNMRAGLYKFQEQEASNRTTLVSDNKASQDAVEEAKLWHLRLGHLSFGQLKVVKPDCDVNNCLASTICQYNARVKVIRSDNAQELIEGDMKRSYSPTHMCFLANSCAIHEPLTYTEAAADPIWVDAMDKEITALLNNET